MNRKMVLRTSLIIAGVLTIGLLAGYLIGGTLHPETGPRLDNAFMLAPPAFAQSRAASFPGVEAGISAYLKLDRRVDLTQAKALFRGVQAMGANYLVGIIELQGLPEETWPHLYVDSEGWILAYYSKYEPASKLMAWNRYGGGTITTTTLREAISKFATDLFTGMRLPFDFSAVESEIHYYDFRYPEATQLLLFVDMVTGKATDDMRYSIPLPITVYEASWTHYSVGLEGSCGSTSWSAVNVDDSQVNLIWYREKEKGGSEQFAYGTLESKFLTVDKPHLVRISQGPPEGWCFAQGLSGIAISFIYR
jgi:hypothetical protein